MTSSKINNTYLASYLAHLIDIFKTTSPFYIIDYLITCTNAHVYLRLLNIDINKCNLSRKIKRKTFS